MSKKSEGQKRGTSPANNPQLGKSCEICQKPDDSRMVACDSCELWYHFACVSEDTSVQDREWRCKKCLEAANKLPTGTSTSSSNTGAISKSGTSKPTDPDLENYLHKQLAAMQKRFERMLKEKDDQRMKELRDQRKLYDQELKDAERRVLEQVEKHHRLISSGVGGGLTASSTENHLGEIVLGGGSTAASGGSTAAVGGATANVFGNQPSQWALGVGPTASSTGNPPPQVNVQDVSQGADALAQELKLLEERQALERKHLEERSQLLQRQAKIDGGAAGGAGLNPQATVFQPSVSSFFGFPSLSQSQVSARQVVSKELPSFSGIPEEWPLFLASYENSTRICGYSEEENMLRLQRSLKGKALEAVRCRLLHPANLPGVIATLKTLFGRPEIIVHSLVNKIREMPPPKAEKLQSLIDFGVAVQNVCATITASGMDEYMCNVALLQELTEKLPPSIRLNWAFHRQTLNRVTLSEFGDWLGKLVEAASIVTLPSICTLKPERRGRKEDNYINVHSEGSSSIEDLSNDPPVTAPNDCIVCLNECSGPENCEKFLGMDVGSRWVVVKEQKLCRKCLRKHFGACYVKTPCGRNGCSFMHSKLLHDDKRYNKPTTSESASTSSESSTTQSCNTHSKAAKKVLFRYVPVTIYGKRKQVTTYAFLDDGSSATLMEHSLLSELGLTGTSNPLSLNWTGGQQREEKESVVLALKISGVNQDTEVFQLPEVHTVRDLSLPKQSVSVSQMTAKYSYLEGLPLESYDSVAPRILIGMNNCRLGHALRSVERGECEPTVSKTRLGWIIYGPCSMECSATNSDYSGYHSFHICPSVKEEENDLNTAPQEYPLVDVLETSGSPKSLPSNDEERTSVATEEEAVKSVHGQLLRSVGSAHCFVWNHRNWLKKPTLELGPKAQEELKLEEYPIYRLIQQQAYAGEIQLIHNSNTEAHPRERSLLKTSPLHKLSSIIDEHMHRSRGHKNGCEWVDEATKHRILLPRQSYVTDLVIADRAAGTYHQNFDPSQLPSDEILPCTLMETELDLKLRPLNDIPLSNNTEPHLTQNPLLLGLSNESEPPIIFGDRSTVSKLSSTMTKLYANNFWKMNCWPLGRVGEHEHIRCVTVQMTTEPVEMPAAKVVPLDIGAIEGKPHGQQWRTEGECHNPTASDAPRISHQPCFRTSLRSTPNFDPACELSTTHRAPGDVALS